VFLESGGTLPVICEGKLKWTIFSAGAQGSVDEFQGLSGYQLTRSMVGNETRCALIVDHRAL